jgi:hypothetical protein
VKPLNAPESNSFLVREESIAGLKSFVDTLIEILARCGDRQKKLGFAFRAGLTGECVRCGVRVSGVELLAMGDASVWGETSLRIQRLRLGRCANDECSGSRYRIIFHARSDLNWDLVFTLVRMIDEERLRAPSAAELTVQRSQRRWRYLRAASLVIVLLLFFLIHQWYMGGRIPLLREPEAFRVDLLPAGAETRP